MISIQISNKEDEEKVLQFLHSKAITCDIVYKDEVYEEVVDKPPHSVSLNRLAIPADKAKKRRLFIVEE